MGFYYVCFKRVGSSNECDKAYKLAASFKYDRRTAPMIIRFPGADASDRVGLNMKGADEAYTFELVFTGASALQSVHADIRELASADVSPQWLFTLKYASGEAADPANDADVIGPVKVLVTGATVTLQAGADYVRVVLTLEPVK